MSLDEVRSLFSEATSLLKEGDTPEAEGRLQKALAGFTRLLPLTHEETLRAAYRLASFFARTSRMSDANHVLNWVSKNHLKKCGARDIRTLKHYLRAAELLQSWSRNADAEVLVHRILESWQSPPELDLGVEIPSIGSILPQTALQGLTNEEVSAIFPETEDARAIDSQLQIMDLWFSTSLRGLDELLPRLIAQCKRHPKKLALQGIRAEYSLARLKIERRQHEDARLILDSAKYSLWELLTKDSLAPEVLRACSTIAFLYLDNNQKSACDSTLEAVVKKLGPRLGPANGAYCNQVYGFVLQVAGQFRNLPAPTGISGCSGCRS
jgi:hypothetical protein